MFYKKNLLKTKNIIKIKTQLTKYLCMCAVYYYKNKVYAKKRYISLWDFQGYIYLLKKCKLVHPFLHT